MAAAVLGSAAPATAAPWLTDSSVQATIHEPAGSYAAALVTSAEIEQNVDVTVPLPGGGAWTGMSVQRLSELLGVAPLSLDATTAMIVTSPNAGVGGEQISRSLLVDGVPDQTGDGSLYPIFEVANADFPTDDNDGFFDPVEYNAGFEPDQAGGRFAVDVYVDGTVLGVPQPAFSVCTPGVGQQVTFSLPPGAAVTLGQQAGAPVDANGLTYSWDFGDGSQPTRVSASDGASYAFHTAGTFGVRVTVVDAAGNAGVSPVAAQVTVGSTLGTSGQCGQVPGASQANGGHSTGGRTGSSSNPGGQNASGGGTGSPSAALSSGAARGSVHAPTSKVGPRKTGAATTSVPADPSSSGSGSSLSGGGGGSGRGGSGGGLRGGGAAGARGTGGGASGAAGGRSSQAGSTASGAVVPGAGAGRTKLARRTARGGALAAHGLTGVLIESSGSPLTGGLPSVSVNPLSLLQSVARESVGGGGSGGLPAWVLGVISLLALLVLGVVREAGPGLAGRLRRALSAGRLHPGAT